MAVLKKLLIIKLLIGLLFFSCTNSKIVEPTISKSDLFGKWITINKNVLWIDNDIIKFNSNNHYLDLVIWEINNNIVSGVDRGKYNVVTYKDRFEVLSIDTKTMTLKFINNDILNFYR